METSIKPLVSDLINESNKIVSEKYVTAYYSRDLKVVGIIWDGVFTKDEYIGLFERLLNHASGNPVIGVYTDIRKQGVVPIDARKHFEQVISPESTRLGIDKTGVVSDASPFKKYYLNTIIKVTGKPAKICSDEQDALDYILS
jgi:hypothetical protein